MIFWQRLPTSETEANLTAILAQAKMQGITAVLVAVPELSPLKAALGSLSDHLLYQKIAETTATPLIENSFSKVLSDNSLKADQVHPNASGYSLVSTQMLEALKNFGFVR
ncbi:MAG: hypothetical protein Q8K83_02445 [Methylotenera sp.]|nr:hypothetical protein [Methylotenera sp.]